MLVIIIRKVQMRVNIHLLFCGQCQKAFEFYKDLLGGSITLMLTYGDSPAAEKAPGEWHSKIVHANLVVNDMVLAGADILPEQYERPQGYYVLLEIEEPSEAERIFKALSEGGSVQMPIQKTFWSVRFGVLVDRFVTPWEINCVQESE